MAPGYLARLLWSGGGERGQVSVAPVRYLGLCLLATAAGAAASPADMGLTWLAAGFGWLHIVYGGYIAWRHNG